MLQCLLSQKVRANLMSLKLEALPQNLWVKTPCGRRTSLPDFAGIVPSSRGAHCRPLHSRLASLCCVQGRESCKSACGPIRLHRLGMLVSCPGRGLGGSSGRAEQQSEIGNEKI